MDQEDEELVAPLAIQKNAGAPGRHVSRILADDRARPSGREFARASEAT